MQAEMDAKIKEMEAFMEAERAKFAEMLKAKEAELEALTEDNEREKY